MYLCFSHVSHDPDPQRTRRGPPQAQDPSGPGRGHSLGASGTGGSPTCGAADARRDAGATSVEINGKVPRSSGPGGPWGARPAMIVADASAVLELLLGTEAAARVGARFLDPAETLHAPHLL